MEEKLLARIAAIIFVALAITATVVGMFRDDESAPASLSPSRQSLADPLREEQRRCQRLGDVAATDPGCLAVWAETRDRFLGRGGSSANPASLEGR